LYVNAGHAHLEGNLPEKTRPANVTGGLPETSALPGRSWGKMIEQDVKPSPWWYRLRGSVIGAIFAAGFFFGNMRNDGQPSLPAAVVWGLRSGDAGIETLLWLGVTFVVIAWLLRLAGAAYLRGDVVFAADVQRDRLIVDGPFRYVRNPLYLGNVFLALGIGLYAPPLGFAIIVLGNVILVAMLANEEALQLGKQYGAEYAAYRAAVPAFVPRFTPVPRSAGARIEPDVRGGFVTESFTLAFAVALVPIAVFGQAGLVPAGVIFFVAMGLFIAASRSGRRSLHPG
jgi:protein-S-isoprenylcysteine O-methyltransferase Ste14